MQEHVHVWYHHFALTLGVGSWYATHEVYLWCHLAHKHQI